MARYVLVEADGFNKIITGGPYDVEDPSQITVPEGQRLMPEDEAFAEGYRYSEGGGAGFAADEPTGADTDASEEQGEQSGDGEQRDKGRKTAQSRKSGQGRKGPQGREGGQGAQVQPGGEDQQ